jgi:signal transduction histidine kinase
MDSFTMAGPATSPDDAATRLPQGGRDWTRFGAWPWAVLAVALAATFAATARVHQLMQARHASAAQIAIEDEAAEVESRLGAYLALLHATRAFVGAQGQALSARSFREFIAGIQVPRYYPGIQGIGFSPRVLPGGTAEFEAAARREVQPDFRVFPPGEREWTFSIRYLEPLDDRNMAALGYDMYSEPVRADAMARARDTGAAAMTGRVILKQEIDDAKANGFLLYVPYYGPGAPPSTLDERRRRLQAFVYAPFRAPDFFGGGRVGTTGVATLQRVHAGPAAQPELLLYEAPGAGGDRPTATRALDLHGQLWTLQFSVAPPRLADTAQTLATAIGGLLVSVLLFLLVRSLLEVRGATEQSARAERRQRELAESLLASERAARQGAEEQQALMARQVQFGEMLVGIVSHDLRNPVNVILLNTELLQRSGLPPPLVRSVGRIQEACRMSLALIRDLLDFTQARLGSGIRIRPAPGDLMAIVSSAVEELEALNPARRVRVQTGGDGAGQWDADRIAQVVFNLVSNALVYGRADTEVTVNVTAEAGRAVLSVHNFGEPIPPELHASIFEPLRQGGGQQGGGARNIGLGLYIVSKIVEAHGGRVDVVSSAAEGTTFRVELPRSAS